jgi:hypothetical protein
MRKYGAGTREVSRAIFSKTLKQIITHPFHVLCPVDVSNDIKTDQFG